MHENLEKFEELKGFINNHDFQHIIYYGLSQWNLVKLVKKHDLNKRKLKTSKIPPWDLAKILADKAFLNEALFQDISEKLNLYATEARDAIKNSDLERFKESLNKEKSLIKKIKTARLIWALLMIPSREKKILGRNMIAEIAKHKKGLEQKDTDRDDGEKEKVELKEQAKGKERSKTDKRREGDKLLKSHRKRASSGKVKRDTNKLLPELNSLKKENARLQQIVKSNKNVEKIKDLEGKISSLEKEKREILDKLKKEFISKEYYDAIRKENDKLFQIVKANRTLKGVTGIKNNSSFLGSIFAKLNDIAHPKHFFNRNKECRVGIFVDVQNMFYSAKNLFHGRLDFERFLTLALHGRKLIKATAYIVKTPEIDQSKFINLLKNNDYVVKTLDLKTGMNGFAKGNWDVGIVMDIFELADQLDVLVLASGDGDFVPVVKYLQKKGIRVEVYGFDYNTAIDLKDCADVFFPIQEDVLIKDARGIIKQH